jgi:ubiquinol-cytochrome c reductase cytochrome b subunit
LYEVGIELGIRDVQLIYKIKDLLGVGVVSFRKTNGRAETVSLRIRSKSHLIAVILPTPEESPLLSNKQYDYLRFRDALLSGVKHYEDLPVRPKSPLNSIESVINVPYFSAWLVGFIEAESCFSIYKPVSSPSKIASFEVSKTDGQLLILAICKHLSLTQSVTVDKTNAFKIKVSPPPGSSSRGPRRGSVRSIENIIRFMHKAPVKLLGHKKLQYLLWLKELRTIDRYTKKINIPDIY